MKRNLKFTGILAGALVLAGSVLFNACKPENPLEGIVITANTDLVANTISVIVENASTGSAIGTDGSNKEVKIKFMGSAAGEIIDFTGNRHTEYTTTGGAVSVGLHPDLTPSASNPVKFYVLVESAGYLAATYPVTITETGAVEVHVGLVEISNSPNGVVASQFSTFSTNGQGVAETEITFVNNSVGKSATSASVTIAAGTKLTAADGTPVSGPLDITSVYFDQSTSGVQAAFSGNNVFKFADGTEKALENVGLVNLEIKDMSGKAVKTFSEGIDISTEIAPNSLNNEGVPIKAGDVIPVASYDNATGVWTAEGTATVKNVGGKLFVGTKATHLSSWFFGFTENICISASVLRIYDLDGAKGQRTVTAEFYDGDKFICSKTEKITIGEAVIIHGLPEGSFTVKVFTKNGCEGDLLLGSGTISCGGYLEVSGNFGNKIKTVTARVSGICPNDKTKKIRPSGQVFYSYVDCPGDVYTVLLKNGEGSAEMELNKNYNIFFFHEGKKYEKVVLIDKAEWNYQNLELPAEACK